MAEEEVPAATLAPEPPEQPRSLEPAAARVLPAWEQVAPDFRTAFPTLDENALRQRYEHNRRLSQERARYANAQETTLGYVGRRAIPFGSAAAQANRTAAYGEAMRRFEGGQPGPDDYGLIAAYERQQHLDQEEGIGGSLTRIPAMVGEAYYGGRMLGAAGAFGRGAATPAVGAAQTIGRAAQFTGQAALTTAHMPSMWLPEWTEDNVSRGRRPYDMAGLPRALGLGTLQTMVFGSLGRIANDVPGAEVGDYVRRLAMRTGVGVVEQQGIDLISGVLTANSDRPAGFGVLGDLVAGRGGQALQRLSHQAVLFGAFAALHEVQHAPITREFADALQSYARAGRSRGEAAAELAPVTAMHEEQLQAGRNKEEMRNLYERMPEGPARDYALALAHGAPAAPIPQGPLHEPYGPDVPPPEPPRPRTEADIRHLPPAGPEPGIDRPVVPQPTMGRGRPVAPEPPVPTSTRGGFFPTGEPTDQQLPPRRVSAPITPEQAQAALAQEQARMQAEGRNAARRPEQEAAPPEPPPEPPPERFGTIPEADVRGVAQQLGLKATGKRAEVIERIVRQGGEPFLTALEGGEAKPAGPRIIQPEPRPPEQPPAPPAARPEGAWHDYGTTFQPHPDGRVTFQGRNGETYHLSVDTHQAPEHARQFEGQWRAQVRVRDAEGKEVGHVDFYRNAAGHWQGEGLKVTAKERRSGISGAMYDYLSQLGEHITPQEGQTPEGKSFWARNRDFARQQAEARSEGVHRDLEDERLYGLHRQGREVGTIKFGTVLKESHESRAAQELFPGVTQEGQTFARMKGINLFGSEQGKGQGQQLFLEGMRQHGADWYFNSQASPQATNALSALARKGLIELHWHKPPEALREAGPFIARVRRAGETPTPPKPPEAPLVTSEPPVAPEAAQTAPTQPARATEAAVDPTPGSANENALQALLRRMQSGMRVSADDIFEAVDMTPKRREALELMWREGLSVDEAGERLGISGAAVHDRVQKFRKKFDLSMEEFNSLADHVLETERLQRVTAAIENGRLVTAGSEDAAAMHHDPEETRAVLQGRMDAHEEHAAALDEIANAMLRDDRQGRLTPEKEAEYGRRFDEAGQKRDRRLAAESEQAQKRAGRAQERRTQEPAPVRRDGVEPLRPGEETAGPAAEGQGSPEVQTPSPSAGAGDAPGGPPPDRPPDAPAAAGGSPPGGHELTYREHFLKQFEFGGKSRQEAEEAYASQLESYKRKPRYLSEDIAAFSKVEWDRRYRENPSLTPTPEAISEVERMAHAHFAEEIRAVRQAQGLEPSGGHELTPAVHPMMVDILRGGDLHVWRQLETVLRREYNVSLPDVRAMQKAAKEAAGPDLPEMAVKMKTGRGHHAQVAARLTQEQLIEHINRAMDPQGVELANQALRRHGEKPLAAEDHAEVAAEIGREAQGAEGPEAGQAHDAAAGGAGPATEVEPGVYFAPTAAQRAGAAGGPAGAAGSRGAFDLTRTIESWMPTYREGGRPQYRTREQAALIGKMAAGDVPSAIHELAHHIATQERMPLEPSKLPQDVAAGLRQFDYEPNRQDAKTAMQEGFAEWLRRRTMGQLQNLSPEQQSAARYLETLMTLAAPEGEPRTRWAQRLDQLRTMYGQMAGGTPTQQAGGLLSATGKPPAPVLTPAEQAGTLWKRIANWWQDNVTNNLAVLQRAGMERAHTLWGRLQFGEQGLARRFGEEGVGTLRDGRWTVIGPSKAKIVETLIPADLEPLRPQETGWWAGLQRHWDGPQQVSRAGVWAAATHILSEHEAGRTVVPEEQLALYRQARAEMAQDEAFVRRATEAHRRLTEAYNATRRALASPDVHRLSPETVERWEALRPDYVPTTRVKEDADWKATASPRSRGRENMAEIYFPRGGSGEQIVDPFVGYEQRLASTATQLAEQLRRNAVAEYLQQPGMGEWALQNKEPVLGMDGQTAYWKPEPWSKDPAKNTWYWYGPDGELQNWRVKDRALYDLLTHQQGNDSSVTQFFRAMSNIAPLRWSAEVVRKGATYLSLGFQARNVSPWRDPYEFLKNTIDQASVTRLPEFYRRVYAAEAAILRGNIPADEVFNLFARERGREQRQFAFETPGVETARSKAEIVKQVLNVAGAGELAPRMLEFVNRLKAQGWTEARLEAEIKRARDVQRQGGEYQDPVPWSVLQDAMQAANEVTVPFSRLGTVTREVNKLVPFFGPAVSGISKAVRNWKENTKGAAVALGAYLTARLAYWAAYKDEDWYKELSAHDRFNNFVVPIPGLGLRRLPGARDFEVPVGGALTSSLEALSGQRPDVAGLIAQSYAAVMPPAPVPPVANVAWQLGTNRNWMGQPIVPRRDENLPASHNLLQHQAPYAAEQLLGGGGGLIRRGAAGLMPFSEVRNAHRSVDEVYDRLHGLEAQRTLVRRQGLAFPQEREYQVLHHAAQQITRLGQTAAGRVHVGTRVVEREAPPEERVRELRTRQVELARRALGAAR